MKRKRQKPEASELPATVASPDTDVESFGPWLRRQREVRGIDRRDVADASKISVRYIDALETNRFGILPAEVFTKGFLRQYAAYVGLDPEEVVNYYLAALRAQRDREEPDLDELKKPRSSGRNNFKWFLAAILIGAVLLAVVWMISKASIASNPWAVGEPTTSSSEAPPPVPPVTADPTDVDSGEIAPPPADAGEAVSAHGTIAGGLEPQTAPNLPAEGSSALALVLDFSGDCWVEATLDGGRRLAEMRVQGESMRLEADSSIRLKLGNGRVVEAELNGRPYPIDVPAGSSVVEWTIEAPAPVETGSDPQ